MNAAVIHAFDAPPRYTTFADPEPGDGELGIEVIAAGLHPIVKALSAGTHYGSTRALPFIPGVDGVGRLPDGAVVYFGLSRPPFGTFAERSIAAQAMCLSLPAGLDPVLAAAIANPGMSSWVALKLRARFQPGENVLILGATGVAGQLAVQVAKRLGAGRVLAVGRNPRALEKLAELGADRVISLAQDSAALVSDLRSEFTGAGVDVVLDYVWGLPAEAAFEAIAQRGLRIAARRVRFVQIGASAGGKISLAADTLRSSAVEILGSGFGSASMEQLWQGVGEMFQLAARQPFQMNLKRVSLRDVESLWNSAEQGARLVFQP